MSRTNHKDHESLFVVYSKSAENKDNMMFKSWQEDADGIIFFNGLFAAVIAALVAVSIQDLMPNPQETSAFYLKKMYQLQADPNTSHPSIPSTTADPQSFSPPTYAIWCARHYLRVTQRSTQHPRDRARNRVYLADGIKKYYVPRVIETLPVPAHLSLFIFFVGLLIYLFNINHTVFTIVMCLMALLSAIYCAITVMPIFWLDCPYYSPLSPLARSCYTSISYLVLKVLSSMMSRFSCTFKARLRIGKRIELYDQEKRWSAMSELKQTISKQSAELDLRILARTISPRREFDELEKAIESIPGFFKSNKDKVDGRFDNAQGTIEAALGRFLRHTLSSNSVPEDIKTRRLATCLKVAGEVLPPNRWHYGNIFSAMVHANWDGGLECVKIGDYLRSWGKTSHRRFKPYIRGVIAVIVASVRERHESNGSWVTLARDHLGIEDDVFKEYLQHGDSVLLANLIDFSHHRHGEADLTDYFDFAVEVVRSLSRFDTRNIHPDLKPRLCSMWNDVVRESHANPISARFLTAIRHHHHRLHQGADAGTASRLDLESSSVYTHTPNISSQSLCSNAPSQRSYPMQHIHNASVAGPTPLSSTTSFLTARAPSPTPSFRSNDTITHPADDIYPPSPRIPLASLSRQVSRHSLSPTAPSDSATITSAQTTARHIFSPATAEPDPSTPVASPPITIVSFPPSPPPFTSDMPPNDSLSSPTPSSSQFNKPPPEKEPPSRSFTSGITIRIRQSSQEYAALSVAKDDASD